MLPIRFHRRRRDSPRSSRAIGGSTVLSVEVLTSAGVLVVTAHFTEKNKRRAPENGLSGTSQKGLLGDDLEMSPTVFLPAVLGGFGALRTLLAIADNFEPFGGDTQ